MILAGIFSAISLALGASARAQTSILDPEGPRATRVVDLWWFVFWLGSAVFVIVMALLVFAVLRARRRSNGAEPEQSRDTRLIATGVAVTTAIVLVLVGLTFWVERETAAPANAADLTIQVTGHQYWWEVRYPADGIVTANEIHIPVGQPVAVELFAQDVIHSFWVPQLSGKMDLVPGRTNTLWLEADEPGTYMGSCAEFCGEQHALMQFRVIADSPAAYTAWVDQQRQLAAVPEAGSVVQRGEQVFFGSACVYCHTIEGTAASSDFGPNLTHLASRDTLAAGTLENNAGNLSAWIIDPQSLKPGNAMPGVNLTGEELEALVAYLQSLK